MNLNNNKNNVLIVIVEQWSIRGWAMGKHYLLWSGLMWLKEQFSHMFPISGAICIIKPACMHIMFIYFMHISCLSISCTPIMFIYFMHTYHVYLFHVYISCYMHCRATLPSKAILPSKATLPSSSHIHPNNTLLTTSLLVGVLHDNFFYPFVLLSLVSPCSWLHDVSSACARTCMLWENTPYNVRSDCLVELTVKTDLFGI